MRVSIVTPVLNCVDMIENCIQSVASQTHTDIEHIVIDGGSTDGTVETIRRYEDQIAHSISERDRGIYDALNKGIEAASGGVIGTLGADDFYADECVIETVAKAFEPGGCDCCFGDILYVDREDVDRSVRYWVASGYAAGCFRLGWMPPHPTFFARREVFDKLGLYRTDLRLSADYELMLRFMEKHRIAARYIPRVLVKMRIGGISTQGLRSRVIQVYEDRAAWKVNGLSGGLLAVVLKKVRKLPQMLKHRGPK